MQAENPSSSVYVKRKRLPSRKQKEFRLFLKRAAVIVVIAAILGAVLLHFALGWRAKDLARKARENFDKGDYRTAFLQLFSARTLRKDDVAVVRSGAVLEGRIGSKASLELWDQLARQVELSDQDRLERTVATLRLGTDEQFARAVSDFEQVGDTAKASALKVARLVIRGDLDGAVNEARSGADTSGDPYLRLDVAKLLYQRHRTASPDDPSAAAGRGEMISVIDSLLGTPAAEQALTFGLGNMTLPDDVRERWVAEATKDFTSENLALLPAVDAQVRAGEFTPEQVHAMLMPVFKKASRDRRASLALWLTNNGLAAKSLKLVSFDEAISDESAFAVRVNALALEKNWDEVTKTVDAASVPESLRAMTRAQAAAALGRVDGRDASVRLAVAASAREGKLEPIVAAADGLGGTTAANEELLVLCGNAGTAHAAFYLLRDRLGRTVGTKGLQEAYTRAKFAAPDAPSVRDFARYLTMYEGGMPKLSETAAAVAEAPGSISARVNHALLLLRYSKFDEAKAAFNGVTIFYPELPAAQQAVIAAVAGASGDRQLASSLRAAINTDILTPPEKALLDQFAPMQ